MSEVLPGALVGAEWLAAHLTEVVVVDVRWYLDGRSGIDGYCGGHIPGAVFVDLDAELSGPPGVQGGRHPLPDPERFAESMGSLGIGDGGEVVAYDDTGGGTAARLWWMLQVLGESAAVLDGGIAAWSGAIETGRPKQRYPASFTARPWPSGATVDIEAVDAIRRRENFALIDARSAQRYAGEENDIDPRFGHIPGARNIPWTENLDSVCRFRPADELRRLYSESGVGEADEVVAYCGSGVSACCNVLALHLVGVEDVRLYVGSWSEWGADPDRPIEAGDG